MHKWRCEASQMAFLKLQSQVEVVQRKKTSKKLGNNWSYNRAEDILFSQKWEVDELLKERSYELTWVIQKTDKKIPKKNMLHLTCLTRITPDEKGSSARYNS